MRDNIFTYINNTLFNKKRVEDTLQEDEVPLPSFLLQRWCSMVKSKDCINIINNTSNRWLFTTTKLHLYKLYVECLPKQKRQKINYIKKAPKADDDISVPEILEMSKREFAENKTLLNIINND